MKTYIDAEMLESVEMACDGDRRLKLKVMRPVSIGDADEMIVSPNGGFVYFDLISHPTYMRQPFEIRYVAPCWRSDGIG